jgi:hypothetical protein
MKHNFRCCSRSQGDIIRVDLSYKLGVFEEGPALQISTVHVRDIVMSNEHSHGRSPLRSPMQ